MYSTVSMSAMIILSLSHTHTHTSCYSYRKLKRKSIGVPDGGDYIVVNESTTSWKQDKLTINIDKPTEHINLQPMHGANVYVQWK